MSFSRRTLAALIRTTAIAFNHANIDLLSYEFEVEDSVTGYNKIEKCTALISSIERICQDLNDNQRLFDIIERTLTSLSESQLNDLQEVSGLLASLNIDGYDFGDGHVVPTTPAPAALAPELSSLEAELNNRRITVAARHYRQAFDNLSLGNFEACNGQIRSFIENLIIVLANIRSDDEFNNPNTALQHLRSTNQIEDSEWNMFRGFWSSCQTNGPHHGLSNQEESIFRLHIATAIGRYLLHKFN